MFIRVKYTNEAIIRPRRLDYEQSLKDVENNIDWVDDGYSIPWWVVMLHEGNGSRGLLDPLPTRFPPGVEVDLSCSWSFGHAPIPRSARKEGCHLISSASSPTRPFWVLTKYLSPSTRAPSPRFFASQTFSMPTRAGSLA